ncbi:MAG: nucleoside deaminase [Leptolyngbya sp. DLM2.Bin27]|nr:MAG: nucleoside deaminase [Leptolyngbya sp. DLM2.Bin27]
MPYDLPPLDLANELEVTHGRWMRRALELAEVAGNAGDVPVGAVVIGPGGVVLAEVGNRREQDQDPTAHAEVLALREAARQLGNWHLNDCALYVTLEPCPMCAGAIILSRLGLLVYGAADPKAGAVRSVLNFPDSPASNHRLTVVEGVLAEPCRQQLQGWFQQRRRQRRQPLSAP